MRRYLHISDHLFEGAAATVIFNSYYSSFLAGNVAKAPNASQYLPGNSLSLNHLFLKLPASCGVPIISICVAIEK